jgi:hypothetical protein
VKKRIKIIAALNLIWETRASLMKLRSIKSTSELDIERAHIGDLCNDINLLLADTAVRVRRLKWADFDRITATEALKIIINLGFSIKKQIYKQIMGNFV